MRSKEKRALVCMFSICAALVAVAHSAALAKVVKLTWWDPYGPPFGNVAQAIIDDFNKSQSGIKVTRKMVVLDKGTFIEKLALAVMTGSGPDMGHVWASTDASELWVRGLTLPMDSYISQDRAFWNSVYPAAMASLQFKGRQLGFPDCIQASLLYWNKDMFAQAGLGDDVAPKFEDLKLYSSKLTKKTADGKIQVVGFHPASIWGGLEAWVSLFGGSLYDTKSDKLTINTATSIEVLEWYNYMTRDIAGPATSQASADWDGALFNQGKTAMFMGNHYISKYIISNKKRVNYTIGLPPAPGGLGSGRGPIAALDANFISRNSKHPNEAYKFMKFFVQSGGWLRPDTPDPACIKSINERHAVPAGIPDNKWKSVAVKVLDYTRPRLSVPGGYRIHDTIALRVADVLAGKKSPQQALIEAQAAAEKFYADAMKRAKWAK